MMVSDPEGPSQPARYGLSFGRLPGIEVPWPSPVLLIQMSPAFEGLLSQFNFFLLGEGHSFYSVGPYL